MHVAFPPLVGLVLFVNFDLVFARDSPLLGGPSACGDGDRLRAPGGTKLSESDSDLIGRAVVAQLLAYRSPPHGSARSGEDFEDSVFE